MVFKKITYEEYKRIAESFLANNPYGQESLPTDIELLIEKSGIIIEAMDDLRKTFSVKGFVAKDVKNNGPVRIIIDAKHYEDDEFEYKFTLAEELAHFLVHMNFYDNIKTVDDCIKVYESISDEDYRKFEQQARNIASFLLLPQNEFCKYVLDRVEKNLDELKLINYESPENFAEYISRSISRELILSEHVIYRTITNRYPDRIIDKITDKFGEYLML